MVNLLQLLGVGVLSMYAVYGFGTTLARNRPTTSSSVFVLSNRKASLTASPDLAVDGSSKSNFFSGSCFSTREVVNDRNPTWTVNLQEQNYIAGVIITNRGDCCANRLTGIRIEVFQNDPAVSDNAEVPQLCAAFTGSAELGQMVPIMCMSIVSGKYVRITKPGATTPLTLCEVVITGSLVPASTSSTPNSANLALNRNTIATSQFSYVGHPNDFVAASSLAVDGNKNTTFVLGQSCFSTNSGDARPSLFVDLGAYYYITSFTITNRGDCCADRLQNVFVGVLFRDPTFFLEIPRLCNTVAGNVPAGSDFSRTCTRPLVGRYIQLGKTIILNNNDLLTVCEFQVSGRYALPEEVSGATMTAGMPLASEQGAIMTEELLFIEPTDEDEDEDFL